MVGGRIVPVPCSAFQWSALIRRPRASAAAVTAAAAVLLGAGVWAVHQPGIANHDGLWIYAQAVRRTFEDWQPVYIAVALSWLVPLGLKFWHLTLAQSLLVCLGVQRLAAGVVRTASAASDRTAHTAGLVTLLLLLSPVTPLAWYLMYFGSDGLLLPVFLWFTVFWFRSYERFPAAGRRERVIRAAGLVLLAAAAVLIRPNAVVLLPVFGLLLVELYGRRGWLAAVAWCAVLAAVRPTAGVAVYSRYPVERKHPEDQVMALDLVGIAVARPSALADLPFTAASLDGERYKQGYYWGIVDPLYPWGHEPIVRPGFAVGGHDRLAAEYLRAAVAYPGTLAVVKLRAYLAYLLEPAPYWHNTELDANDLGLFHHPKRRVVRDLHLAADRLVYANPVLQWASARHVLWLGVNAAGVAGLGYVLYRRPSRRAAAVLLVLLVPLGYYLSFVPAVTTNHFRLMYPSTLVVQVATVALAVNHVRRRLAVVADQMAAAGPPPG